MSWTDRLLSIFKSEAKDVKSGLDSLKGKLDAELTERENRMAATPTEKMDMLQGDIAGNEDRFDQLADEVRAKHGVANAEAEVAATARGETLAERLDSTTSTSDSTTDSAGKASEAGAEPAAAPTVDQAISDAMADAGPDPEAAEAARQEATRERRAAASAAADAKFAAQKEKAEDTLDELRAELGLED